MGNFPFFRRIIEGRAPSHRRNDVEEGENGVSPFPGTSSRNLIDTKKREEERRKNGVFACMKTANMQKENVSLNRK